MICTKREHQGIAALRETIDFLNRENETYKKVFELRENELQRLREDKDKLIDKLLTMSGAGPLREAIEQPLEPLVSSFDAMPTNVRDYTRMAELLEAKVYAEDLRNSAIAAAQEAINEGPERQEAGAGS